VSVKVPYTDELLKEVILELKIISKEDIKVDILFG